MTFDVAGSGAATASSTSMTIDISTAATGSHVFLWVSWGLQNATFTLTGWTAIGKASTASTLTGGVFYRKKVAGDTTFTLTTGSAKGSFQWVSHTALDNTTPYQSASNSNLLAKGVASNTVDTPSIASTSTTALPLAMFASRSSTTANKAIAFTMPAGLTERVDANNSGASSGIWTGGAIGEGTAIGDTAAHSYTATASFSETYGVGALLYLNPASTGPGPVTFRGWGVPV